MNNYSYVVKSQKSYRAAWQCRSIGKVALRYVAAGNPGLQWGEAVIRMKCVTRCIIPTANKNDRCMFPQAPGGRVHSLGWPRINSGARSRLPKAYESNSSAFGITSRSVLFLLERPLGPSNRVQIVRSRLAGDVRGSRCRGLAPTPPYHLPIGARRHFGTEIVLARPLCPLTLAKGRRHLVNHE